MAQARRLQTGARLDLDRVVGRQHRGQEGGDHQTQDEQAAEGSQRLAARHAEPGHARGLAGPHTRVEVAVDHVDQQVQRDDAGGQEQVDVG